MVATSGIVKKLPIEELKFCSATKFPNKRASGSKLNKFRIFLVLHKEVDNFYYIAINMK